MKLLVMLNTGLVGNTQNTLMETVAMHPGFNISGCFDEYPGEHRQFTGPDKKIPLLTRQALLDNSEAIIFMNADGVNFELLREALKRSRHIMMLDACELPAMEVTELIKLREEAQTVMHIRHMERSNPALQACRTLISHPALVDLKLLSRGTDASGQGSAGKNLSRILDALLFICPPNIRKIQSLRQPAGNPSSSFVSARIEFDNGSIANLLSANMSESESFIIEFYQNNRFLKVDVPGQNIVSIERYEGRNEISKRVLEFTNRNERSIYDELENFHQSVQNNSASGKDLFEIFRIADLRSAIIEKAGIF